MPDGVCEPDGHQAPSGASSSTLDRRRERGSRVVRLHIPFLLGVLGCLLAGRFELSRALAGRQVAWVYALEWPFYAILGTVIWWRLLHDRPPSSLAPDKEVSDSLGHHVPPADELPDPGLVAWQQYLAKLQAADPPGGPPGMAGQRQAAGTRLSRATARKSKLR